MIVKTGDLVRYSSDVRKAAHLFKEKEVVSLMGWTYMTRTPCAEGETNGKDKDIGLVVATSSHLSAFYQRGEGSRSWGNNHIPSHLRHWENRSKQFIKVTWTMSGKTIVHPIEHIELVSPSPSS